MALRSADSLRTRPAGLPLLLLAFALVAAPLPAAAQPPDPFEEYTPPGVAIRREDLPLIRCEVCRKIAEKLTSTLDAKRARATPSKPVDELQIIELTEKICSRKPADRGWIPRTDMVEDGDHIKLVEYNYNGDCRSECRTLQKACEDIVGYHDTDIAEALEKPGITREELEQKICYELSDACVEPVPPLPKGRKPGEKFEKEKPKDFGKIAEEIGIQKNVMHNNVNFDIPEDMPVMPPPEHLRNPSKQKLKKQKKSKKRSSRSTDWESMSEL